MGIHYENLDDETRALMLDESAMGNHYDSPRLSPEGLENWAGVLNEAIQNYNDDWLAAELMSRGYLRRRENYTTKSGDSASRKINQPHAAKQLAEGEFNRFYLRGLCRRAQNHGVTHLIVYRGKAVSKPRPESEEKIGMEILVDELLETLRSNDFVSVDQAFAVPSGPNSGLTARLP